MTSEADASSAVVVHVPSPSPVDFLGAPSPDFIVRRRQLGALAVLVCLAAPPSLSGGRLLIPASLNARSGRVVGRCCQLAVARRRPTRRWANGLVGRLAVVATMSMLAVLSSGDSSGASKLGGLAVCAAALVSVATARSLFCCRPCRHDGRCFLLAPLVSRALLPSGVVLHRWCWPFGPDGGGGNSGGGVQRALSRQQR